MRETVSRQWLGKDRLEPRDADGTRVTPWSERFVRGALV